MTNVTLVSMSRDGKVNQYAVANRGTDSPRPWTARSLSDGTFLGAFPSLERAEHSVREYVTGWRDETVLAVVRG